MSDPDQETRTKCCPSRPSLKQQQTFLIHIKNAVVMAEQ